MLIPASTAAAICAQEDRGSEPKGKSRKRQLLVSHGRQPEPRACAQDHYGRVLLLYVECLLQILLTALRCDQMPSGHIGRLWEQCSDKRVMPDRLRL